MSHNINSNWVNLLCEEPHIAPDIIFRVLEEVSVDGKIEVKSELVQAHKFVLAMVSDAFKAQFYGPMSNHKEEVLITGTTAVAFKELVRLMYTICNCECNHFMTNVTDVEILFQILSLSKMYLVNSAINLIEDKLSSMEITQENVISAGIIAEKCATLQGFEAISEKVLLKCSTFLKKSLNTVLKMSNFLAFVERSYPVESLSIVVRLLSLDLVCPNCKSPTTRCLSGLSLKKRNDEFFIRAKVRCMIEEFVNYGKIGIINSFKNGGSSIIITYSDGVKTTSPILYQGRHAFQFHCVG